MPIALDPLFVSSGRQESAYAVVRISLRRTPWSLIASYVAPVKASLLLATSAMICFGPLYFMGLPRATATAGRLIQPGWQSIL